MDQHLNHLAIYGYAVIPFIPTDEVQSTRDRFLKTGRAFPDFGDLPLAPSCVAPAALSTSLTNRKPWLYCASLSPPARALCSTWAPISRNST